MTDESPVTHPEVQQQAATGRTVVVTALIAGIVGGLSGYGMSRWHESQLDLRARPRVAVVSYAEALEDASAEQVAARMAEMDAKAQRLSDAGFVVFNDNAVVASPSGLRVPVGRKDD